MPVGGETLVVGPYTATWNSVALGVFEGDAGLPSLEHQAAGEDVGNTSAYGRTVIDSVYLGANWFSSFTCIEYKAGPISAFWPYHATLGRLGTIGVLLYTLSQALVLTAVAGTSAATAPATLTASKSILLPGFTPRIMFGPKLRTVPLRMRLFPYDSAGAIIHFSQT
jgi:hypothetical protein